MASALQVILTQDSQAGKAGDLVRVKPGYARNFLLPKGLAVFADADAIAEFEERKEELLKQAEELRAQAEANKEKLGEEATVTVDAKAGESGKLFGAITKVDIVDAVKHQYDIRIAKEGVNIKTPIKAIGEHKIQIDLGSSVKTDLLVSVKNSEA